MSGPGADAFRLLAQRIGKALRKATTIIGGHDYRRTADVLQGAATGAARTGSESAAQIGRASHRFWGPRLEGIDSTTGEVVSFRPRHVHSIQLNDATGKPIGVAYPTDPDFDSSIRKWASAPVRTSDRSYTFLSEAREGEPTRVSAPWAADTEAGRPPTYIIARGNMRGFAVMVEKGGGPAREVLIPGDEFARLVRVDEHFRRARELAHPQSPIVVPTSMSGHPDGSAGWLMEGYLYGKGMEGDMYFPTGYIGYGCRIDTGPTIRHETESVSFLAVERVPKKKWPTDPDTFLKLPPQI